MSRYGWRRYVPVAQRLARARKKMEKLRKKGLDIQPVQIGGRKIARTFWGEAWCGHLESFSDYENRLPRGRTYVRNGSVCHLEISKGVIEAMVSGSELYKVKIAIKTAGAQEVEGPEGSLRRADRLAPRTAPGSAFRERDGGRDGPEEGPLSPAP